MRRFFIFAFILSISISVSMSVSIPAFAAHSYSGFDLQSGKDISILRSDKRVTVLIFMSSKCPCSMSHADEMLALAKDFPEMRFVGINSNGSETKEAAAKYFSSFPFPVLRDEKAILAEEFKAVKTPHAFVLSSEGERLFQGGVSNSATFARADHKWLREALDDLSAKRPVRTPLARTLGCSIERP